MMQLIKKNVYVFMAAAYILNYITLATLGNYHFSDQRKILLMEAMQKGDSRLRGWWTKHRGSILGLFSMSGSHIFWVTCWLVACWLWHFDSQGFHLFYMLTIRILTIYIWLVAYLLFICWLVKSRQHANYWWKQCQSATQWSKLDEWRMKAASLGWYIIYVSPVLNV